MRGRNRSTLILVVLLIVGVIIGGVIGDLLQHKVPFLAKSYPIGIKQPIHLDLNVVELTFGIIIDFNVASLVGLILAILLFRKI